jgi:hypothetical protein
LEGKYEANKLINVIKLLVSRYLIQIIETGLSQNENGNFQHFHLCMFLDNNLTKSESNFIILDPTDCQRLLLNILGRIEIISFFNTVENSSQLKHQILKAAIDLFMFLTADEYDAMFRFLSFKKKCQISSMVSISKSIFKNNFDRFPSENEDCILERNKPNSQIVLKIMSILLSFFLYDEFIEFYLVNVHKISSIENRKVQELIHSHQFHGSSIFQHRVCLSLYFLLLLFNIIIIIIILVEYCFWW